jgi:hypothetical protein
MGRVLGRVLLVVAGLLVLVSLVPHPGLMALVVLGCLARIGRVSGSLGG